MCKNLNVSVSGYYDWQKRDKSTRQKAKEQLMLKISHLFHPKLRHMAGSEVITRDLHDNPKYKTVHRSRVAALMKEMGLRCKVQKKFVVTTDSEHDKWIAGNLLDRNFTQEKPGEVLVGDITYIQVASHWVYLSLFIDLYSRKVVGWDLSESLTADSTCKALEKYIYNYGSPKGFMVNSDRGIQYASEQFRSVLKSAEATQSMCRKGNCWDNAVAESFFPHTENSIDSSSKISNIWRIGKRIFLVYRDLLQPA